MKKQAEEESEDHHSDGDTELDDPMISGESIDVYEDDSNDSERSAIFDSEEDISEDQYIEDSEDDDKLS